MIFFARQICLVVLLALFCITITNAFSAPPMGIGSLFFKPKNVVKPNLGDDPELLKAATFFTESFWAGKSTEPNGALTPKQYKILKGSQSAEFRKRYGSKMGKDRRAELLVCKNEESDEIYGCAGIEVSKISTSNGRSVQFPAPLMSNLAVGKNYRRKGLAEDLVKAAEELVLKQWGYNECYLYVEKKNKPALKLYKKLGYKVMWEDDTATSLTPTAKGNIVSVPTVILCMKRTLGTGLLGRFFS